MRSPDVRSRASGDRDLFKARRARAQIGRVHTSRPTRTALSAEVSRLQKAFLGESRIGGNELVERKSIGLSLPGEELLGRGSHRRAVMSLSRLRETTWPKLNSRTFA